MTEDAPEHCAFAPRSVSIPAGTTVTWTDMSDAGHTVTSDTGVFGPRAISEDQTFRLTFNEAGTFRYHCSIHPYMHGTIIVAAAAQATVPAAPLPAAPAQVTVQMPNTDAGGMALADARGGLAALLAAAGGLVGALRRQR